jgi:lipoprotein-releasing system permease protein
MEARVVEKPFGPFERMLSMRYLRAKREHGGLALISIVSVIGITLAVWALIVIMSVMNGFRIELVSKIVGFEPHLYVYTEGMSQPQVEGIIDELKTRPGIVSVEPTIEGLVLASAGDRSEGLNIRGIRPEDLRANRLIVDGMARLKERGEQVGSLDNFGADGAGSDDIIIGQVFARALGLRVGDTVSLLQANGARTVLGQSVRRRTFTVAGIFHVGTERYDRGTAFLPIEAAKNYLSYDEGYPTVGARMADPDSAVAYAQRMMADGYPYVETWIFRQGGYITALQVERNVMRLILFIVVIITALNIITGVLMLVKNKARDVAILRTLGATRAGVVRIFLMTGSLLGMVGVLAGVVVGVLFCIYIAEIQHFLEGLFGFQLFPADVYMLDSIPAKLEWGEVGVVAGGAFVVAILMSIIPSMWAARLNPVEALRFE